MQHHPGGVDHGPGPPASSPSSAPATLAASSSTPGTGARPPPPAGCAPAPPAPPPAPTAARTSPPARPAPGARAARPCSAAAAADRWSCPHCRRTGGLDTFGHVPSGHPNPTRGGPVAVVPSAAATVVLLRDGRDGPRRISSGGRWGWGSRAGCGCSRGRVDEGDRDPGSTLGGPSPAVWAERLGSRRGGQGHVVAACRETLEEGLLLATPAPAPGSWRRPAGAAGRVGRVRRAAGAARGAAGRGPAALLGLVGDAGDRAAPLRHPLLRRRVAGRRRRHRPPGRGGAGALAAGRGRGRPGPADAPPDPLHPARSRRARHRGGRARRRADRRVERILPVLDGAELVMPWGSGTGAAGPDRSAGRPVTQPPAPW